MTKVYKLNLIKKEIDLSHEYDVISFPEKRWFVETNDGFDGTAEGYGYKSARNLYKAYAYFKTKGKRGRKKAIKKFLANNPDVIKALVNYLEESPVFIPMKDRVPKSIENMLKHHKDEPELVKKFQDHKHLWRALIKLGRARIHGQTRVSCPVYEPGDCHPMDCVFK